MVSAIPVRGYLRIQARGCPGGEISEGKGLKIRGEAGWREGRELRRKRLPEDWRILFATKLIFHLLKIRGGRIRF
ncbi:hypothetical protein HMPREF1508_1457 [Shuttleworthella sp. MSX8B]|uniref:hypothetical protein n=1 Tax=Shuttleworthella sp. MSX8B TaxID=936574 RepID=UPI0004479254|nr:hypothetical protein [Shuttleworthia sp. MSX8B]EUB16304.1 hypothetical protein HMPREF1508_1457 [Shuttleworthia sp. MSX8B]